MKIVSKSSPKFATMAALPRSWHSSAGIDGFTQTLFHLYHHLL